MSALPSLSKSPTAKPTGCVVVVRLTAVEENERDPGEEIFCNIATELLPYCVEIISGLPSPSISKSTMSIPYPPTEIGDANELAAMVPLVAVFLNIETVPLYELPTAKSILPSPSKSPNAIVTGFIPTVKSTFAPKELVVIDPLVEMFRNTEIVLPTLFAPLLGTIKSDLPSPSISAKYVL